MATIRRELNRNFIKWEPVEGGCSRFTPCAPVNWDYEVQETSDESPSDYDDECGSASVLDNAGEGRSSAAQELARITPSNEELKALAAKYPPPADWFEEEEGPPF